MNAAAEVIYDLVDPSANLIFGAVIDQSLSGQVSLEGLEIYIYTGAEPGIVVWGGQVRH